MAGDDAAGGKRVVDPAAEAPAVEVDIDALEVAQFDELLLPGHGVVVDFIEDHHRIVGAGEIAAENSSEKEQGSNFHKRSH